MNVQQEFHRLSRNMTYATIVLVCILAMLAWWLGIEVKGRAATIIGAMFIVLAVVTFQIPYITYRYMLRKYKHEPEKLSALGSNWHEFRDNAMQRRS